MKTFSHPPTVAVCTREREGWVGDGPKGSYLSNFRRLQKEQPRAAALAAPLRAPTPQGEGRNRAYFDSFRKYGLSKADVQKCKVNVFTVKGKSSTVRNLGQIGVEKKAKKMRRHR